MPVLPSPAAALALMATVTLLARPSRAQSRDDPPPPGVAPSTWARIPRQVERDPFATTGLGFEVGGFGPLASRWGIPQSGGRFEPRVAAGVRQLDASIGALHFFGHADLFVTIPLAAERVPLAGGRSMGLEYAVTTGVKLYPWPLRPSTVRPYVSSGILVRTLRFSAAADPADDPGRHSHVVVPIGLGLAWRSVWHVTLDAQMQYVPGSVLLASGVQAQPLDQAPPSFATERLDLRGWRVVAGLKWNRKISPVNEPGFRAAIGRELQRSIDAGTASAINLALGASNQLIHNESPYFDSRRPYLKSSFDTRVFPHAAAGYYHFPWDAELRLAHRRLEGDARAYGVTLDVRHTALFLEALKFFDLNFYGFVPFVGAGVGYGRSDVTDRGANRDVAARASGTLVSIPFGWDIRPNPASSWLLRTNLRWVPRARADWSGTHVDLGGLEFDLIQLVVFPERIFKRR